MIERNTLMAKQDQKTISGKFSKDNTIAEVSSKQSKTQTRNVVAPTKPKETKKK